MIYFDNAATTYPKPPSVYRTACEMTRHLGGNASRSGHFLSQVSSDEVYRCRCALGKMFGAEPENVVFTLNATYALNMAIKGIAEPHDRFIISDIEHNAVLRPMVKLKESIGCDFDVARTVGRSEDEIIDEIAALINQHTKAVVMTHASNLCSFRMPIRRIGKLCKEKGILFVLDASQSAGHTEINMKCDNINILCAPAHKGLYGIMGLGFLISDGDSRINTLCEGGSGYNSADTSMPADMPEHLEAGTLPIPAIAALRSGIYEIERIGFDRIEHHEKNLFLSLKSKLERIDRVRIYLPDCPGPCLLFNIDGLGSTTVDSLLAEKEICIRSGLHCSPLGHSSLETGQYGAVRASFGIYNNEREVSAFADAVKKIAETHI